MQDDEIVVAAAAAARSAQYCSDDMTTPLHHTRRYNISDDTTPFAPSPNSFSRHFNLNNYQKSNHDKDDTKPPMIMRQSSLMVRVYYVNHHWKSVVSKFGVVIYMFTIFWMIWKESSPWYEFFYYLTLQGWTLELIYFSYSLYLDLLSRWYGGPDYISRLSKAAAQALSELVFALQVVIFLFFWIVVYPQEKWRSIPWELNCHGIGLVLILADYLYRFTGFSLRNHRYIVLFAALYTFWYAFIVLYMEKSVYPGIDLRSTRSIVIFLSGLSTVVFTHKTVYLLSNWKWIKEDVKSLLGVSKVILFRQNSLDMFTAGITEFGSELLSLSPRATAAATTTCGGRSKTDSATSGSKSD